MRTIKGPALLISQLADDKPPFNSLPAMAKWAAGLCYKGLQLPSLDARFIDVARCAESQTYADEIIGTMKDAGLEVTELATALEGQLVCSPSGLRSDGRRLRPRLRPGQSRRSPGLGG